MSLIPPASLHLVVRKKVNVAVTGNWKESFCPSAPPSRPTRGGVVHNSSSRASLPSGGIGRAEPDAHPQCVSF